MGIPHISVWIPKWHFDPRIAYLIIGWLKDKRIAEVVDIPPNRGFYDYVEGHVNNYLEKGMLPPGAIGSAIMNLADDILAGRQMVIRAGDYIELQDAFRKGKTVSSRK